MARSACWRRRQPPGCSPSTWSAAVPTRPPPPSTRPASPRPPRPGRERPPGGPGGSGVAPRSRGRRAAVPSGRAGPEGPPPAVLARFAGARVARLATIGADGPRLVPVTFAWHRGTAVWAVDRVKPKRHRRLRRERDLAADPRVALLADHYAEDWTELW